MNLLRAVNFYLPKDDFANQLLNYLAVFGEKNTNQLLFTKTYQDFLPQVGLKLGAKEHPEVEFIFQENTKKNVLLINTTNEQRNSSEVYEAIPLHTYLERTKSWRPTLLDHIGFNLPWFYGTHPEIISLRQALHKACAYYRFPTGEDWDFILPASKDELTINSIDLKVERRPKIEIVSFMKASTPLIQIDFLMSTSYKNLKATFPESIAEEALQKVWIYIQNPYQIDICLVIGAGETEDWSDFFRGYRLMEV